MVGTATYVQYDDHEQGRDLHPASQQPNNHKSRMDDCVRSERTNNICTGTDSNVSNSRTKRSSNNLNELKTPPSSSRLMNSYPMDAKDFMVMAQSAALELTPAAVNPVVRRSFLPGTHEFQGLIARNGGAYRRDIELTDTSVKSYDPVANPPLDYLYSGLGELPDARENQSQLPNTQSAIAADSYRHRGGISALLTTHHDNGGTLREQLFNDNDESVTEYTGRAPLATMKRTNNKGVHAINRSNVNFQYDMQRDIFDPLDSFRSPCPTPKDSESEDEAVLAQGIAQIIETQQKTLIDISLSNQHLIQQLVDTTSKASAPHRGHQKSIVALKAKMDNLEKEKLDYQSQIEKMTQIVSQLSKRGLPHPPDDSYLKNELDGLAYDIMQFSRAFTRGLKKLTPETLSTIHMSENVKKYLHGHFLDLNGLVSSGRGETRVRTRCVQVIMFERLTNHPLRVHPIGLLHDHCHQINETLASNMLCSDEETHMWKALTIHLLSKNNKTFLQQQEKEINALTESVYEDIAEWGEFKRVGKDELKEIVAKVAKLGLELAQLPFGVVPLDLKPGAPFDDHYMKDADEDINENEFVGKTTIILSYPWVKMRFDEDGKKAMDSKNILSRAQVSCLQ